jgi:hypothetical protein
LPLRVLGFQSDRDSWTLSLMDFLALVSSGNIAFGSATLIKPTKEMIVLVSAKHGERLQIVVVSLAATAKRNGELCQQ